MDVLHTKIDILKSMKLSDFQKKNSNDIITIRYLSLLLKLNFLLKHPYLNLRPQNTQCNGQIASHFTTYPKQYVLLGDLVHSIHIRLTKTLLSECLPSVMDKQRLISLPTLSSILFQMTQNFHYFYGGQLNRHRP